MANHREEDQQLERGSERQSRQKETVNRVVGSIRRRPEEDLREERHESGYLIKDLAMTQVIVGKIVTGVGFLALTWSTVVLLGGFVGALQIKEFWSLTTVSLVLASSILAIYDYNSSSILQALSRISRPLTEQIGSDMGTKGIMGFLPIMFLIPMVSVSYLINIVLMINIFGPLATVAISMKRLIQHDYDGSDAANNGKLREALPIFYWLALVHGVCFYYWFLLRRFQNKQIPIVSKQCGFGKWGWGVLREYLRETNLKCANDLSLPAGWNLVTYAVGLLDSVSPDDNLSGVRMLDTFVVEKTKCIRVELLSSRRAIQNLITMLGWTTQDVQEIRECAARIMADISSDLRIGCFPGALQCVSSLLEASPQKRDQGALGLSVLQGSERSSPSSDAGMTQENTTTDDNRQRRSQLVILLARMRGKHDRMRSQFNISLDRMMGKEDESFVPKGPEELILQGLLILERLTYDEHNCREIVNTPGLLSKITAPITSQAFLDADDYDDTWVSILSSSLRVVSRLITAPGEAGKRLHQEISDSKEAIHNMLEIVQGDTNACKKLQEQAIEILTELALGPTDKTKDFVKTLERIFLDRSGASRLRRKAGEALAKLLATKSARGLHHQLSKQDVIDLLTKILDIILSTKIERKAYEGAGSTSVNTAEEENDEESQPPKDADQNKPAGQNDEQSEERKFVAALLSLTVVICDRLIDANDFCYVVPMDLEGKLIKKLKDIIDRDNDTTSDCLRIVKLTCQVVIAMMKLKPGCIKEFNEHNFDEVFSKALKTLSDLDTCMFFFGNDRDMKKPARSLASLVKEAHQLFNNAK